jgi:two-component system chemotaxis response regulator CheY
MGARVLLADDLSFMRMVQREILKDRGYVVVAEATNGLEAVELFSQHRPDLTILDITMPQMNGLEATKRILAVDPKAAIIICSALGQQKLIVEAIQLGVRDFIVKPFKPDRLVGAIRKALKTG